MSDRLTQLQICLDQLIEQFNATVHYVNTNSKPALLDEDDPTSVSNIAANAPIPQQQQQQQQQPAQQQQQQQVLQQEENGQTQNNKSPDDAKDEIKEGSKPPEISEEDFETTIDELSTDIVLKSRQINMLIDSLPGIGVTPEEQLQLIKDLSLELQKIEQDRISKIKEKDELLFKVDEIIENLATGTSKSRI
ncbi:SRB7 [Candida jiufengensis]|uniref:SRB7 n=1 Tax=Candida jiufengensis TaxID=497108 RepID=UPI0022253659|nr:SRB7 [Candida jiufengensis]KAI5957242.1 SRB7 [Candida jiufengensis]